MDTLWMDDGGVWVKNWHLLNGQEFSRVFLSYMKCLGLKDKFLFVWHRRQKDKPGVSKEETLIMR